MLDVRYATGAVLADDNAIQNRWLRVRPMTEPAGFEVTPRDGQTATSFAPFIDKPGTPKSERFKAVGGQRHTGLVIFSSEDGIHWKKMFGGKPVLRGKYLDSMNRVFWSESEQCYVLYARIWKGGWKGHRWIGRATSEDLEHWTPLEEVRMLW